MTEREILVALSQIFVKVAIINFIFDTMIVHNIKHPQEMLNCMNILPVKKWIMIAVVVGLCGTIQ